MSKRCLRHVVVLRLREAHQLTLNAFQGHELDDGHPQDALFSPHTHHIPLISFPDCGRDGGSKTPMFDLRIARRFT